MRHVRLWVQNLEDQVQHPAECRERGTWCEQCKCCEHCVHDCDCKKCDCWRIQGLGQKALPIVRVETDVT